MVMFCKSHRTSLDEKRNCGLPMTEDNVLGSLTPSVVGYLDKVQERCTSLDNCPWCASKGLTYALRSYRINFQDSITLCTNPQCLFPLVSRPLEDILANLVTVEPKIGGKRKNTSSLEREVVAPSLKRLRSRRDDCTDAPISPTEPADIDVCNGVHTAPKADSKKLHVCNVDAKGLLDSPVNLFSVDGRLSSDGLIEKSEDNNVILPVCLDTRPTTLASASDQPCSSEEDVDQSEVDNVQGGDINHIGQVNSPREPLCGTRNQHSKNCTYPDSSTNGDTFSPQINKQSLQVDQELCTMDKSTISSLEVGIKSEPEDLSLARMNGFSKGHSDSAPSQPEIMFSEDPEELVPVPPQLFWKNAANLCWLDVLLTVLVNCKTLRMSKPKDQTQQSPVWGLITQYDDICSAIRGQQLTGTDGVVRVPIQVLEKANSDLEGLRMSIFQLLHPKLQCQLGQRETPVFAMPLLLASDMWAEPLFQLTFHWEHQCSNCKSATNHRVTKSLSTFTNIVPNWHPLHAAHLAPCNTCCQTNTTRTMVLERVAPVLALHFVEGLPDNDVRMYSFSFQGKCYSVTSVIQYDQHLMHFASWIRTSDGSWQEFDDLKHPHCATHARLPVPAKDIHIVFWEAGEEEHNGCSPSTTALDPSLSNHEITCCLTGEHKPQAPSPDQSLLVPHNDTDIITALSVSDDACNTVDTSIGSTTLLDTFEGLTHTDIVTLTLVEVKVDSKGRPQDDSRLSAEGQQSVPGRGSFEELCTVPDASCAVTSTVMPHDFPGHTPVTSDTSDPDTADGSSSDPTYVPGARVARAQGKSKGSNKQKRARTVSAKVAPGGLQSASSEHCGVILPTLTVSAAETEQKTTSVSHAKISPSPELPPTLDYNTRWSYLQSRHPLYQMHSTLNKTSPSQAPAAHTTTQAMPSLSHSTPKPARKPRSAAAEPKPQLRREGSDSLPVKAAEMYGAFSAKNAQISTTTPQTSTLPQKTVPTDINYGKSHPIPSGYQTSQINPTTLPASLPPPAVTGLPKVPSSKRDKLLKKLKAKKKKLEELNWLLRHQGGPGDEATQKPDSTALNSPQTVTSSGYDGSTYDEFFADLLSPATTAASSLSPDSTGFLEMIAYGQEGGDPSGIKATGGTSQFNVSAIGAPSTDGVNILDEFISVVAAQQQTEDLGLFF